MFPKLLKSPVFIIFTTAVISYWPVAFFTYTFKWDMLDVVYPFRYFAGECLQNGTFPLWNPYQLTGSPMHADLQYPLWSPEVWLTGLISGYNIYILHILFIVYIFLAGYGMFRLTAHLSKHRMTSIIIGISYMLSGFFVGHGQALFSIIGGAFLPWVVLYMIKNLENPSFYYTIKLALFIFLLLTTGYQTISIITGCLLACIFTFFLINSLKNKKKLHALFKFNLILIILVLLLCLVLIVPIFQVWYSNARLGEGLTYMQSGKFSFTFNCLISLFAPLSTVKNPEFYNTDISMRNMYFGIIMLPFFLTTVFKRKSGFEWLMLLFGFICLLASFGDSLPVHKVLYQYIPLIDRTRMPAYFNLFALFSILLITGTHLPGLLDQKRSDLKPLIVLLFIVLGLLAIMFTISVVNINYNDSVLRKIIRQPASIPEGLTFYEILAFQSVFQGLIVTCVISALLIKKYSWYILLLVIFEMIVAVNLNIYYTVISTTKPGELHNYLTSQPRGFPIPDNTAISDNSDQKLTHAPLWRNMGILTKRISFDGFTSFVLKPYEYLYDSVPFLKDTILNNSLIYLSGSVHSKNELRTDHYPRKRSDLFVSDSLISSLPVNLKKDIQTNAIYLTYFSPAKITAVYNIDSAAIITLLQSNYPGWEVKIDGNHADHFTSNFLYLSSIVPAGNHEVTFEYKNKTVIICFIISYSVLCILLILLFQMRFRSRSVSKANLLSSFVIISALLLVLLYFRNNTIELKKERTYKMFSEAVKTWKNEIGTDHVCAVFNIDDTIKFRRFADYKNSIAIKFMRFNNSENLGAFYDFLSAYQGNKFIYAYCNLFNPVEIDAIIRDRFPFIEQNSVSLLGAITVYSRTSSNGHVKLFYESINDFESYCPGWSEGVSGYDTSVIKEGFRSERLDSTKLYSTTFRENINKITQNKARNLIISADVFLVGQSDPLLVFEEKNDDFTIRWLSLNVRNQVKHNEQWAKVYFAVPLTINHSKKSQIGVFFWNHKRDTFYIDNFKIISQ